MAEQLRGYNGAVDGMNILHGVAIAQRIEPGVTAPSQQLAQARQTQQKAEIEPIVQRAIEVIGDREEAMRWLGTPVRALDFATPISRLHDPDGREQVLSVLAQLEHGVL